MNVSSPFRPTPTVTRLVSQHLCGSIKTLFLLGMLLALLVPPQQFGVIERTLRMNTTTASDSTHAETEPSSSSLSSSLSRWMMQKKYQELRFLFVAPPGFAGEQTTTRTKKSTSTAAAAAAAVTSYPSQVSKTAICIPSMDAIYPSRCLSSILKNQLQHESIQVDVIVLDFEDTTSFRHVLKLIERLQNQFPHALVIVLDVWNIQRYHHLPSGGMPIVEYIMSRQEQEHPQQEHPQQEHQQYIEEMTHAGEWEYQPKYSTFQIQQLGQLSNVVFVPLLTPPPPESPHDAFHHFIIHPSDLTDTTSSSSSYFSYSDNLHSAIANTIFQTLERLAFRTASTTTTATTIQPSSSVDTTMTMTTTKNASATITIMSSHLLLPLPNPPPDDDEYANVQRHDKAEAGRQPRLQQQLHPPSPASRSVIAEDFCENWQTKSVAKSTAVRYDRRTLAFRSYQKATFALEVRHSNRQNKGSATETTAGAAAATAWIEIPNCTTADHQVPMEVIVEYLTQKHHHDDTTATTTAAATACEHQSVRMRLVQWYRQDGDDQNDDDGSNLVQQALPPPFQTVGCRGDGTTTAATTTAVKNQNHQQQPRSRGLRRHNHFKEQVHVGTIPPIASQQQQRTTITRLEIQTIGPTRQKPQQHLKPFRIVGIMVVPTDTL